MIGRVFQKLKRVFQKLARMFWNKYSIDSFDQRTL